MLALEYVLNSGGYFYCIFFDPVLPSLPQADGGHRGRERAHCFGSIWDTEELDETARLWLSRSRWHSNEMQISLRWLYFNLRLFLWPSGNYTQHTGYNPKMTKSRRSSSEQLLDTCNTTKHHSSGYREETLPFSLRSTRWRSFRLYPSQLSVNTAKGELAQT